MGTGGLIRAYTKAAQACLSDADVRQMVYGSRIHICIDYSGAEKLKRLFSELGIMVTDTSYSAAVDFTLTVDEDNVSSVLDKVTQTSNGNCELEILDSGFFMLPSPEK